MDVFLPRTLEEALAQRAERPDALPICGGTDVMVALNFDLARPEGLLDLSRVRELAAWHERDGEVFLRAGVTYTRILHELPQARALAEASRSVGSPQIRNRGTVGGNLGTASPAGDALPVLAVHDAEIGLVAAGGRERWLAWRDFLLGVKRNALAPDELILGARWPALTGPQSFSKIGTRNAMVISVATLCFALDPATRTARVALGSVAPTVVRAPEAETYLAHELARAGAWDDLAAPLPAGVAEAFAERVVAAADPIDDVRGTAAYRRHAVAVLARRALGWAVEDRAGEAMVG
jgi:CO/xanthine dehydrogenase FAD-binding subunit